MTSYAYTGIVRLECGNELRFPVATPMKGQEVWCTKCQNMEKVAEAYKHPSYRIKCNTCRYGKQCGSERLAAELAIVRHRNKKGRHHQMVLMDHRHKVLWATNGDPAQPELPLMGTETISTTAISGDDVPPY